MTELDFLDGLAAEPSDLHRQLVYADWLEENGDLPRALIVRAVVELETTRTIENAQMVLRLSDNQSRSWLERLPRPSLHGLVFGGISIITRPYHYVFEDGGQLAYFDGTMGELVTRKSGTGRWI
jgi:uncharacterized protein (TIGR02996 family)